MKIWLITDTHFGHRRMEDLCGRPKDFEDKILKALNNKLEAGDLLVHLGDFCIGQDLEWHRKFNIAKISIIKPVKLILIRGNHDKKSYSWYLENGWDMVCENMGLNIFGKKILFSHIPILYDKSLYDLNIHGHLHNNRHHGSPEDFPFQDRIYKLLSIENQNYQPILLRTFLGL